MDPAISDAIKSTVDASIVRPSNNPYGGDRFKAR